MPTPPSSANLNGGIMPSGTDDLRKRNDSEIMSEKQNRTISQEASHVRLEAITINQVVTKQHAPSALNSDKTPAKSISRRRDEASAKLVKIQTRLDPTTIDISSSNTGRKPYKRTHLGQTTEETSRAMALTPSSPMDVSLLSVSFRLSKVKRFRQTSCVLWRLPNISEINTEFSDRKNILLAPKPRRVMASKQGLGPEQASRPQSITTDGSEQPQPAGNRTAETFLECKRISSPHTGTKQKANQDDFPWVALERRSFCGALKEVGAVPKSLLKIMPLELLQLLEEDGRRCTARTTQGNRCKLNHPIGSMSAQLQSLASLKPGALLPVIQNLIEVVFCAIHQKVALKETILWKEEFEEVSKIQDYESMITIENKRLWALLRWGCLLKQEALSQPISTSLLQHTVEKETLPINPIQEFKHYVSKRLSGTISEELAMLLTRPLTQSDLKHQGSMYIFWQPRNFGHLKIGGSVNVPCRLDQWNKQCKKTMETIFPENVKEEDDKTVDSQQVPHISRVEALVHLELLRHRRIEKKCPGCLKSHVEWFEIPKDIAIGVVRKWSTWMLTLPYEKQMRDGKEQWILKARNEKIWLIYVALIQNLQLLLCLLSKRRDAHLLAFDARFEVRGAKKTRNILNTMYKV